MAILITAAATSAAFRLERILGSDNVYFADHSNLPAIPGKKFLQIPAATSNSFSHELLKICLDFSIAEIYTLRLDEITELAKSRLLFEEFGISLIIPSDQWLENKINVSSFRSYSIIILINGTVRAGVLPDSRALPENEKFGVFAWEEKNDLIGYSLFLAEHTEV